MIFNENSKNSNRTNKKVSIPKVLSGSDLYDWSRMYSRSYNIYYILYIIYTVSAVSSRFTETIV